MNIALNACSATNITLFIGIFSCEIKSIAPNIPIPTQP